MAFVFGSTISLSFADFQDGGVRGSRGSFVGPVQRIGFTASHGSVAPNNPYLSGYRGGVMGYPEYRGPLVAPNSETVGSRNGFIPSPASQIGTIRRHEVVPQTRDLNPPAAVRPFGTPAQGPQHDSAEIKLRGAKLGHNIYLPIPRPLKRAQGINEKFQRYENKFASDPRISDDRRERLDRARVFLAQPDRPRIRASPSRWLVR